MRQHGALAVDVDRAALEHERRAVAVGAFDLEHLAGDALVAVPGEVQAAVEPAPGVEVPVHAAPARRPPSTRNVGPVSRIQASSVEISTTRIDGGEQRAAVLELGVGDGHRHRLGQR